MKKILRALLLSVSLFSTPALLAEIVNINKASAAALQENLKGVGEKKAMAIVAYRKEYGEFKTLDEIMEVKGIGKGIFKKIKADIALDKGVTDLVGKKPIVKATKASKSAGKEKADKTAIKTKDKTVSKVKKPLKTKKTVTDSNSTGKVKKSG